jgi:hypothetical protein
MPVKDSFTAAFGFFGAVAKNKRSMTWAAQSQDGKTVVLTMWLEEILIEDGCLVYGPHPKTHRSHPDGEVRPPARDRIEKLEHARDHCKGRLRAVIIDRTTHRTRKFIVDKDLWMNVEHVDKTGAFCVRSDPLTKKTLEAILFGILSGASYRFPNSAFDDRLTWREGNIEIISLDGGKPVSGLEEPE